MKDNYTTEEKINHAKEAILKYVSAKYIYLFGSCAYGEPNVNSDIDICAVIPDEIESDIFLHGNILEDLSEKQIYEIDLVIKPESKFNYRKTRHRFEETIFKKGKLVYENP